MIKSNKLEWLKPWKSDHTKLSESGLKMNKNLNNFSEK